MLLKAYSSVVLKRAAMKKPAISELSVGSLAALPGAPSLEEKLANYQAGGANDINVFLDALPENQQLAIM
eukprot:6258874-Heterocapsa_arctica.AAC.1